MAKKNKKVLISGYIGFKNFGDDVMLQTLVHHLKEKGCQITALSSDVNSTKENFGINALYYKSPSAILKGILTTDILISGGGNLIQNETSTLSLLYYLFIIFLSKLFFKKVIIFSQGIGPVRGRFFKWLSAAILRKADIITVRDIYSQRILSKRKINSKFTYDACWSFKTPPYNPQNIVGLQVRDYDCFHKDFYKNIAKYTDMFFSDYEIRIYSMENKNDAKECYNLEKALKLRNSNLRTKVVLYKNPDTVAEEFSHLKYLIAMRLHATILGLKYGVKVLPVSYSVKVRNLAYEFNLQFIDASEEGNIHGILTDLTLSDSENSEIENARKRQFEWSYIDTIIDK